jgi:hypothetical protein
MDFFRKASLSRPEGEAGKTWASLLHSEEYYLVTVWHCAYCATSPKADFLPRYWNNLGHPRDALLAETLQYWLHGLRWQP